MNSHRRHVVSSIEALVAIALLQLISESTQVPLLIAPFGATVVLLFALPDSPLCNPRNVIGGYLISGFIGLAILNVFGMNPWTLGLSVAMSLYAMQVTRTVHPPAGAVPVLVMLSGPTWIFLLHPLAAGIAILLAFEYVYREVLKRF